MGSAIQDGESNGLSSWVGRVRSMVDYLGEATEFVGRVRAMLPALESDVAMVCELWTVADEHDVVICDALARFDEGLFDGAGNLEITRGAEPRRTADGGETLVYMCTWSLTRSNGCVTSVVLEADQAIGSPSIQVVDTEGQRTLITLPLDASTDMYRALAHGFFKLAQTEVAPVLSGIFPGSYPE